MMVSASCLKVTHVALATSGASSLNIELLSISAGFQLDLFIKTYLTIKLKLISASVQYKKHYGIYHFQL